MNKIRPILLAITVVLAALLAYGVWTRPSAEPADHEGFSAARVIKDIEVMSKEHHSVAHPEERAKVREYLMQRLEGLGADTVMLYEYDSLDRLIRAYQKDSSGNTVLSAFRLTEKTAIKNAGKYSG